MSNKKILIIEDEPDAVSILKMRLERNGFDVVSSIDGKEGFEKARAVTPDLILLDLMLPKVDGYWVCNMLKSDKRFKDIPIIILSAKSAGSDIEVAKECGADGYIVKPFEFEELLSKIKKLME